MWAGKIQNTRVFVLFFGMALGHAAFSAPKALVYKGPGACKEDCSEAAALVAERAGFEAVFVEPSNNDPTIFANAAVWMQPGGQSNMAYQHINENLRNRILKFVSSGGGYVGFCAGGFMSTSIIGDTKKPGLGILPGSSSLFEPSERNTDAIIVPLEWQGRVRQVYWEGGPYFTFKGARSVGEEVVATYPDGSAATVRSHYGRGRVFVTGAHPEAPEWWRSSSSLKDSDGLDYDLAVDMVRWATDK